MRQNQELEQMLGNAQETLQQGIETLSHLSDQARDILENKPGVVLASVTIAGFVSGLLLRQGKRRFATGKPLQADPVVMFAASAIAGFAMGPKILQELARPKESSIREDSMID